jgi:GR25 family glycosyltransferase involved in LPS biosynthesis
MTLVLPRSWSEFLEEAPCFVLGLERYEERRADACRHLRDDVGFRWIFLAEGVDGHARPADLEAVVEELWPGLKWKESLSPGHRGCSLGHMRLWHHIATSGIPYGVIFEDDVLPHPRIGELGPLWWADTTSLSEDGHKWPAGYEEGRGVLDMVLLGNQMNPDFLVGKEHIPVLESPAYCLHAYVLTAAGARKLLDAIDVFIYSGRDMYMNDILVFNMMCDGMLNYVCWNRGLANVGWPVFSLEMDLGYVKTHDVAVWARDTGLFYQNARWGTTLSGLRRSYLLGTADATQDKEIKEYLRRHGEPV